MTQAYERLETEMPLFPPIYEDSGPSLRSEHTPPIEQFEIDDDEAYEPRKRGSLLRRLQFMAQRAVYLFQDRVVGPLSLFTDPLYEGYSYFSSCYELSILRIGNPLVVKRLLYVLFVVLLVYFVTENLEGDGVNGSTGGAFSSGKFYDVDKLSETLTSYIEARTLKENLEYFSSMPHLAGSKGDLALAKYVESFYSNNGVSEIGFLELESFLNYPTLDTYLKLADGSFSAKLSEGEGMHSLAFNPNSPESNGEIEASYIYGNYGDPEDLQKLVDLKISLKDSILLIRYGGNTPEPNKVYAAHRLDCKAVVFISPLVVIGDAQHDDIIQKVNVGLTRFSPGDVLTPGWPSHDGYVTRLDWSKSMVTPKIPTIPISWKDGRTLVEKLGKNGVDFGDGMFSGSDSKELKMKLNVKHLKRPIHQIWNVVGSILGREQSDKGIIFGAARDSTCYGASSTASGTAALLELVKIFTALQRRYNWTPSRSIYFASFDASAYNLAGSAEWVEDRKRELVEDGYAYIDLNTIVNGDKLSLKSHPLLQTVLKDALRKVELTEDQKQGSLVTLYDLYKTQNQGSDDISNTMIEAKDYSPFINQINTPSMELHFGGGLMPVDTCFDSFANFEKTKIDPNMSKHIQIVKLAAIVGLNLAEQPFIPYDYQVLAAKLADSLVDLKTFVSDKIAEFSPHSEPHISYNDLQRAIGVLSGKANTFKLGWDDWNQYIKQPGVLEPSGIGAGRRGWNGNMIKFNSDFLLKEMQPERVGYLNLLFGTPFDAPAHDDGKYEWNTFPMVREYAEKADFDRVQVEIQRIATLITSASQDFSRF